MAAVNAPRKHTIYKTARLGTSIGQSCGRVHNTRDKMENDHSSIERSIQRKQREKGEEQQQKMQHEQISKMH